MGLTYYKGEPYGDGSISPGEILTFYAVEGEAPSSGYISKVDTGEVDEHGNPIFRIEIPMGTTIENAFASDTVETHIVEDSERVRLQANVGTRLKWGNRPREGIIAGGIRVLLKDTSLCLFSSAANLIISHAKQKIDNYIYSDVTFPQETVFNNVANGSSKWSCDLDYWTEQGLDWREYQERFPLRYYLNSYNSCALYYPNEDIAYHLVIDPSKLIIQDKIMTVPNTVTANYISSASTSTSQNFTPNAFGVVFFLNSIVTLSEESGSIVNADLSKTYAKVTGRIVSFKNNTGGNADTYAYEISNQNSVVQSNNITRFFWIPMSEDEVRYAMGISDVFDQMSYEEYIRHLPQEV